MTKQEEYAVKYPEHHKLRAISDKSQVVGNFMDWLSWTKNIELAVRHRHTDACCESTDAIDRAMEITPRRLCGYQDDELMSAGVSIKKLLAEFFEIDEEKIEAEKRAMLEELQAG